MIYAGDKPLLCRRKKCGKQITSKLSTQIQTNTSPLVVRIFLDIGTKSIKARTEYGLKVVLYNNGDADCVKPVCSIRKTPTKGADVKFDHMRDPSNWLEIYPIKRIMCGTPSELDALYTLIKNHGFDGGTDDISRRHFQQLFKGCFKDFGNDIVDFDAVPKELAVALPSGMPFEQQTRVLNAIGHSMPNVRPLVLNEAVMAYFGRKSAAVRPVSLSGHRIQAIGRTANNTRCLVLIVDIGGFTIVSGYVPEFDNSVLMRIGLGPCRDCHCQNRQS
jgi:hypothetical protein